MDYQENEPNQEVQQTQEENATLNSLKQYQADIEATRRSEFWELQSNFQELQVSRFNTELGVKLSQFQNGVVNEVGHISSEMINQVSKVRSDVGFLKTETKESLDQMSRDIVVSKTQSGRVLSSLQSLNRAINVSSINADEQAGNICDKLDSTTQQGFSTLSGQAQHISEDIQHLSEDLQHLTGQLQQIVVLLSTFVTNRNS